MLFISRKLGLGRRGIFSVGVCPIIPEGKAEAFAEIEHLFAAEASGLEDVGLWGAIETADTKTYEYSGTVHMNFQERLYFNCQSVNLLYKATVSLLERVYQSSVLWTAKRFSRSLGERELAVFLLTGDRLSFQDPLTMQIGPLLDVGAIRNDYSIFLKEDGTLSLRDVDEKLSEIAGRIGNEIDDHIANHGSQREGQEND